MLLMGGLHIEMAIFSVISDWLSGSGWSFVMTAANVTTEGRITGVLKGNSTFRGQWAPLVTASSLSILLTKAYIAMSTRL